MKELKLGHRVKNTNRDVNGMVAGAQQANGVNSVLVPVVLEGSTRRELWPIDQIKLLPKSKQLIALGGKCNTPKGYPLHIK